MAVGAEWPQVEERLLEQVFHRHDPAHVRRSEDLPGEGLIDSLSVTAALEVLVDASDDERFLFEATAADFTTLTSIRSLYERIHAS